MLNFTFRVIQVCMRGSFNFLRDSIHPSHLLLSLELDESQCSWIDSPFVIHCKFWSILGVRSRSPWWQTNCGIAENLKLTFRCIPISHLWWFDKAQEVSQRRKTWLFWASEWHNMDAIFIWLKISKSHRKETFKNIAPFWNKRNNEGQPYQMLEHKLVVIKWFTTRKENLWQHTRT